MKFIVVYESILDEFDIGNCPIMVKVTEALGMFSKFKTIQSIISYKLWYMVGSCD